LRRCYFALRNKKKSDKIEFLRPVFLQTANFRLANYAILEIHPTSAASCCRQKNPKFVRARFRRTPGVDFWLGD
jgi:hypothetical protein